jgi:integrase
MATIEKRGKRYRVKVYHHGKFESATFALKAEANAWAYQRESELSGRLIPVKTFADACNRYGKEISPKHKGEKWELLRLNAIKSHSIGNKRLERLGVADFTQWRNEREQSVSEATVLREINLINAVIEAARRDWGWIRTNPLKDMRKPKAPPSRKRRVSQAEIDTLIQTSRLDGIPLNKTQLTAYAFLFALETGMRSGEILGIEWHHVSEYAVLLPKTKNGDSREVPLSPKARTMLSALAQFEKPFPISSGSRDAIFRKLVVESGLTDLHFHDSRAEAIYRMSKKLDVFELARTVGHRDIKSLMFYYRSTAQELSDKLADKV